MISKSKKIRKMKRKNSKVNSKYIASCDGKIRYDTYAEAKADADELINAHAYKCDFGQHYHKGRRQS